MEYGLIGEKLGHSFSKEIHAKIFDYDYELKEIAPLNLEGFMLKKDFKAINVTIPYKQAVIPYLDEIDETAKKIGAVNTIVNRNGRLLGFNTDFFGMRSLILKNGIDLNGKKVLILGSGGTSKTALAVAENLGANEIYRVSRNGGDGLITYDVAYSNHLDADIIINTTPCGMFPKLGIAAIDISRFKGLKAVVDAVYNPLRSRLLLDAEGKGIKVAGGLYMLVAQAVAAAEHFKGVKIPQQKTDEIFLQLLNKKQNIVLIGMPACGKSTIGKILSNELNMTFIDSDSEIVALAGCSITEIFDKNGERGFRDIEAEVISRLSFSEGAVIATGGGAILRKENVDALKANGILIFLDRSLERLATTPDRPLSSNLQLLKKRYDERYEIYCSVCDIKIDGDGDPQEVADAVKEAIL